MKTQKKPVSRVNPTSKFTGSGSSRIADPKNRNPPQDDEDDDDLDLNLDDDLEDLNYDFDDEDEY
jgi:hypothetical protein